MVEVARTIYDLWNSLQAILLELRGQRKLKRVLPVCFTVTPTAKATTISSHPIGNMKIVAAEFKVRSMGTATYIGLGDKGGQEIRLTAIKDYWSPSIPNGCYVLLSDCMMISDATDAVVEVIVWMEE
jgi:hypothetical protein